MTLDTFIDLAPVLVLCTTLGLLLAVGRKHGLSAQPGWRWIVAGFALLLFGSCLHLAASPDGPGTVLVIGGVRASYLLETLVGTLFGLSCLGFGLVRWLPTVQELRRSQDRLAHHAVLLEAEVAARAAGIDEANRELRQSEERFRGVVENSPSAIFLKDLNGQFRLVNRRFEDWYGVAAEAALGKTSYEIFPELFADAYVTQDKEVLERGTAVEREQDIVFQDGSTHTILVTKFPVLGETGAPLGIGTINTDLTEHKRALTALRESETALAEAQKVAKVGNWRWSVADADLVSCSQEFARFHDVDLSQDAAAKRQQFERAIHPDDRATMADALNRAAEQGQDYQIEYRIIRPDGEIRQVLMIAKAVFDDSGRVLEFTGTAQDVTEQKRAETALLAAKEQAELASRAKTEFLANMSHELRTPLNWIIGFAELIKNEMLGPIGETKYREYIEDIHTGGLHLLDLINDLLDLAQIESGNAKLHEKAVDLGSLVTSCAKLMTERAASAGVRLGFEIPTTEMPQLYADQRMVKQILINLLSNSIKFTPQGGEVVVRSWLSPENQFVIQVTDNGIGIAPNDIPKALGRFQQVEGHLSRTTEGSGLGLALTKSFAELHGGTLDLESSLGEGTTVTVRFSADRTLPPAEELDQPIGKSA